MADEVARLVAVLESNIKGFTKGMEQAQLIAERRLGAVEKQLKKTEGAFSNSFKGNLSSGLNLLATRFLGISAAIGVLNRITASAAANNDEVKASIDRMNEAYRRLGDSAAPTMVFLNDRMVDVLDSINNVITGLKNAATEIRTSKILGGIGGTLRTKGIPFASAATPFARFDKQTGNITPGAAGFPVPGVTDVTPKKADTGGKTVAEREAALTIETARKVEEAIGDLIAKHSKEDNEFRAKQYLEARELRNSAADNELHDLDQFHEDAKAAWDNYYEHLHEMVEEQARLEELANEKRRDDLRDTLGEISTLTRSKSNELRAIGKAAAIAQATIDGILAVQKALASAPPPFNFALAALVGAATAANVAEIAAMERGGRVQAGTPYIVGEKRPELFVPDTAGTIIPKVPNMTANGRSEASGGTITINAPVDARGAQIGVAEQIAAAQERTFRMIERRFPTMMIKAQRDRL